jgi:hypothetical protein
VSAEPAVQNLEVFQGAYWSQRLEWQDSGGSPIDLTGYTARMQVRKTIEADDVVIELTTANGRITLGDPLPTDGVILLEIEATATDDLPATLSDRKWRYDLELIPAGGQVRRLMMGKFVVSLEVTR